MLKPSNYLIGLILGACFACQAPTEQKNTLSQQAPSQIADNEVDKIPGLHKVEDLSPYGGKTRIFTSIQEAKANPAQVFRLQLNSFHLHQLPNEIWEFKALEELYLTDNYLSTLPQDLAQKLPKLRVLDLNNNRLVNLPAALTQLAHLEYLNLAFNQISTLPPNFAQLKKLQVLNLENNQFQQLPPQIFSLPNLKHLFIRNLKIKDFSQFAALNGLQQLSLENCGIAELPQEILQFKHLERLSLANNQLLKIPTAIGNLSKLTYLNLAHNRLKNDLNNLTGLKKLLNLDISYNPIASISDEWWLALSQLKAINLSFTLIEELSANIAQAKGLVWLALNGTKIRELPATLSECRRLQDVYLGYNPNLKITETVILLSNLPKLRALSLINLQSGLELSLPKEIIHLRRLRKLDLKGNRFNNAEDELAKLSKLTDLEAINLSRCGLRQAFSTLSQLKNLRLLGLDIQNMPRSEVQKLPKLLAPQATIVDGSEFFEYKL
jgi:leucine-rich repeat protein SHOC2